MAYDKHTWQCGEAITVERLNHIENGIASGGGGLMQVYMSYSETEGISLDHTIEEIYNWWANGGDVVLINQYGNLEYVYYPYSMSRYDCKFVAEEPHYGITQAVLSDDGTSDTVYTQPIYTAPFEFIINEISGVYTTNTPYSDIVDAKNDNRVVYAKFDHKIYYLENKLGTPLTFTNVTNENGNTIVDQFSMANGGAITRSTVTLRGNGGYDFIIRRINPNDPVVFSGDFNEVYNKVVNREPVFGYFVNYYDYYDAVMADVIPLCYITNVVADHNLSLAFSKTSYNSVNSIYMTQWNMIWSSSGITSSNRNDATINGNP